MRVVEISVHNTGRHEFLFGEENKEIGDWKLETGASAGGSQCRLQSMNMTKTGSVEKQLILENGNNMKTCTFLKSKMVWKAE